MLCDLEGWDGVGGGREVQEGGDICVCKSESVSPSVVSNSLQPHGLSPPGSSVHGIL